MVLPTMVLAASNTAVGKPITTSAPQQVRVDDFGVVRLFKPTGAINGVVLLASGDGRWEDPLPARIAQLLVSQQIAVVGIDTVSYLQAMDQHGDKCVYFGGDFEDLAHAMEKQLGLTQYIAPTLLGYSSGASLVYAVLAQVPRGTFQAGLSLGFCSELAMQHPLCSVRGDLSQLPSNATDTTQTLLPINQLSAKWMILHGELDNICTLQVAQRFSRQVSGTQIVNLQGVDHFFAGNAWQTQLLGAYQQVQPVAPARLPPVVKDLPVTEVPATKAGDELAILLTGDGGWAELDQELARDLSRAGVSVVALSSLQYFWQARQPTQAAADVARLIQHYSQVWQRPHVRLLGYSFGADVLPAIINALPAAQRAQVISVGLLSLLPRTSFEIRVAGWLGQVVGEQPVLPQLKQVLAAGLPVTCVYGADDADTLCRQLPRLLPDARLHTVQLPGGHDCDDDHAAIVRAWLQPFATQTMMDRPAVSQSAVSQSVVSQSAAARRLYNAAMSTYDAAHEHSDH